MTKLKDHSINEILNQAIDRLEKTREYVRFIRDILDPDVYGSSVSVEVQNRARELLNGLDD